MNNKIEPLSLRNAAGRLSVPCLRAAYDHDKHLMVAECYGSAKDMKTVRNMLCTPMPGERLNLSEWYGDVFPCPHGYTAHFAKIRPGLVHALFVSLDEKLMLSMNQLEAKLRSARYTTPFLPEWLPYIGAELERGGLLLKVRGFQPRGVILRAETEDLDEIVSEGVRKRHLKMEAA